MGSKTVGAWLAEARCRLNAGRRKPNPAEDETQDAWLESQVLLASVLGKPRAWLIAHPEAELDQPQQAHLAELMDQLAAGAPLPYLLGQWEFYGLDFIVTPAVLIPRPETELLVERAAGWLRRSPDKRSAADVGTGSGCIAISLARQFSDLTITAVDCSRAALQVARQNTRRHAVDRQVHLYQGDLLSAAAGPFDLVCANLPYIPTPALAGLAVARHEPRLALDGGPDGLSAIRALLADARRWLAPGGLLLLEMQFDQSEAVQHIAGSYIDPVSISVQKDLAGLPRLVELADTRRRA